MKEQLARKTRESKERAEDELESANDQAEHQILEHKEQTANKLKQIKKDEESILQKKSQSADQETEDLKRQLELINKETDSKIKLYRHKAEEASK